MAIVFSVLPLLNNAPRWLKMYQFGAGMALKDYGLHKHARFAGSSAGALVSSALILDCDFHEIKVCRSHVGIVSAVDLGTCHAKTQVSVHRRRFLY